MAGAGATAILNSELTRPVARTTVNSGFIARVGTFPGYVRVPGHVRIARRCVPGRAPRSPIAAAQHGGKEKAPDERSQQAQRDTHGVHSGAIKQQACLLRNCARRLFRGISASCERACPTRRFLSGERDQRLGQLGGAHERRGQGELRPASRGLRGTRAALSVHREHGRPPHSIRRFCEHERRCPPHCSGHEPRLQHRDGWPSRIRRLPCLSTSPRAVALTTRSMRE